MEATVRPRLAAVAIAIAVSLGIAATRAYFVEPKTSANGWTEADPNAYVGQSFVANVDSIYYLEWFCGQPSATGQYVFQITQGGQYVCGGEVDVPSLGWKWLRCDNFTGDLRFTKGKEYVLKVSHSAGDSVNFVYRTDNPYSYGHISVSGGELVPEPDDDLVARVYGRMNAVDSSWWGYQTRAGDTVTCYNHNVHGKAESAGVGMARIELLWASIWSDRDSAFDFSSSDAEVAYAATTMGCKVIGLLDYTAKWASSRVDMTWVEDPAHEDGYWRHDTCEHCPPVNLDKDTAENYWYRYVKGGHSFGDIILNCP